MPLSTNVAPDAGPLMLPDVNLTTEEVAEVLGVHKRTIDEIDRRHIVCASRRANGRGSRRCWSVADLVAIYVGLEWRRAGVEWDAIRKLVQHIQKSGLKTLDEYPYVALCGSRVWACREDAAFDLRPSAQMFVCDLRPGVRHLVKAVNHCRQMQAKGKGST